MEENEKTNHEAMAELAKLSQELGLYPTPFNSTNNSVLEASLRRLDAKAAIGSAAMESLVVPPEIRALLDRYAEGTLTAAELTSEALRIYARSIEPE